MHEPHPNAAGPSIGTLVGTLETFNRDPQFLTTPLGLGVPDWVFYGVIIPWVVSGFITILFCLCFFVEDDLSLSNVEPDEPGTIYD